jgi:ribosome biogenesis GTPase / thiamine phosphate phosphatase
MGKPKKSPREKDLTSRYLTGGYETDDVDQADEFRSRNKTLQQDKMAKTAAMRAEGATAADIDTLPIGEVVQVFSLFSEVQHEGKTYLCVVRRTLSKLAETFLVVGDQVRFRDSTIRDKGGKDIGTSSTSTAHPEGVIEEILPRRTILTRADSFKGITQSPIIANAEQVLIVASIRQPYAKWGLIDRMLVAAQAGGLKPIVCLNKVDLAAPGDDGQPPADLVEANGVLEHYAALGIQTLRTSVEAKLGIDELRELLKGRFTVLAGHSGVGKSSLVRAMQPSLDLKVGEVSRYTDKGRHTTTSARKYPLEVGGAVVDTPGVKQFGLWGVTRENLEQFFPDVATGTAPEWRKRSYERVLESLPADEKH